MKEIQIIYCPLTRNCLYVVEICSQRSWFCSKVSILVVFVYVKIKTLLNTFAVTAVPQCSSNQECRTSEVCHTGSCINACLIFKCGANAICSTTVHDVACTCQQGFTGNGRDGCILCK